MSGPVIASKTPVVLDLEPGTYWWCRCGRSQNQPFCDGSHKMTEFSPVKLVVEEKKRLGRCRCKHTEDPPYCDNSHKTLS